MTAEFIALIVALLLVLWRLFFVVTTRQPWQSVPMPLALLLVILVALL